ncbi:methyltransferase [Aureimonas leprariae]|uniref:Methyltransferase domain-containing protein n=1 Tax=Plantimonas leprariae TaxID=2615207 RepID=A0A7V7U0G3_9HYPH|nr:methyltransferase [Aureimonas leprariae]KAB0680316.1 methyltransferase domain-containing protein [Aureimonas leprariae]
MLPTWLDRMREGRVRRIADPDFRRRAANSPLTKGYARRQAKALFDLSAGFVYSQILYASVRCGLFDMLAAGPLELAEIARRTDLPEPAAERLLKGAAALDLVEARGRRRYALGSLGAALVDNPGARAMILHHDMLYRDLADPIALLRGETQPELGRYWTYGEGKGEETGTDEEGHEPSSPDRAGYTELMAASQGLVNAEILDAYTFRGHKRLLDVGGGDGSFLIAVGKQAPHLELTLFDLPAVAGTARANIARAGLADRGEVVVGDLFADALPAGADVVTLNRVLHDHDDEEALAILEAVRRAIAPGGTLLVTEPMAGTPGARESGDAYFGFYLFAVGQGRPRTTGEIGRMLHRAGFDGVVPLETNTPVIARSLAARARPQPLRRGPAPAGKGARGVRPL